MVIPIYKTYMFKNKDPVIDELRTIKQDVGITNSEISEKSNVSSGTLNNWFKGTTRRPQNATVEAVGRALGMERRWVKVSTVKPKRKGKKK